MPILSKFVTESSSSPRSSAWHFRIAHSVPTNFPDNHFEPGQRGQRGDFPLESVRVQALHLDPLSFRRSELNAPLRKSVQTARFLLVYYGTDGGGGWQRLDQPLRTVTTIDRFAYVRPAAGGVHQMRMLQVSELRKAMGFDRSLKLNHGTRRDQIKLLGNAVCPPVMKAIVEKLTSCD
jgi:site-specific DNA-cytosine methylase